MTTIWRSALRLLVALVVLLPGAVLFASGERDQFGDQPEWQGPSDGYTVVDFAASWCLPCHKSLPRLEALAKREPAVRFLVVSVDKRRSGRDQLVEHLGLTLPVLWDENHRIAEHYQPEAMPATLVLDPSGKIVYRHVGYDQKLWAEFESFLESLE